MKKILSLCLSAAMICTVSTSVFANELYYYTEGNEHIYGDINMDGAITLEDAQQSLKCALRIENPTRMQLKNAALKQGDVITLGDAQTILKKALRIDTNRALWRDKIRQVKEEFQFQTEKTSLSGDAVLAVHSDTYIDTIDGIDLSQWEHDENGVLVYVNGYEIMKLKDGEELSADTTDALAELFGMESTAIPDYQLYFITYRWDANSLPQMNVQLESDTINVTVTTENMQDEYVGGNRKGYGVYVAVRKNDIPDEKIVFEQKYGYGFENLEEASCHIVKSSAGMQPKITCVPTTKEAVAYIDSFGIEKEDPTYETVLEELSKESYESMDIMVALLPLEAEDQYDSIFECYQSEYIETYQKDNLVLNQKPEDYVTSFLYKKETDGILKLKFEWNLIDEYRLNSYGKQALILYPVEKNSVQETELDVFSKCINQQ